MTNNFDLLITQYILSMGLALSLAILVAFRAGRLPGLNTDNIEERLGDLAFDSVKEEICNKLMALFNLYMNMPLDQDFRFPARLTIQQVAAHIHNDVEETFLPFCPVILSIKLHFP